MRISHRYQPRPGINLAFIFGFAGALLLECTPKDVPYVNDKDQITAYLNGSPDARQLFRSDNLIWTTPYQIPGISATYRDSVLSYNRQISVQLGNSEDYGYLGNLTEALAIVSDNYTVLTTKTDSSGSSSNQTARAITRYGVFLKLGSDNEPYVGWVLYLFNGFRGSLTADPNVSIKIAVSGVFNSPADSRIYVDTTKDVNLTTMRFVKLSNMSKVAKGSQLIVEVNTTGVATPVVPLLAAVQDAGVHYRVMPANGPGDWVDTVQTQTSAAQLFDVAVVQFFNKTTAGAALTPITIPYRAQ